MARRLAYLPGVACRERKDKLSVYSVYECDDLSAMLIGSAQSRVLCTLDSVDDAIDTIDGGLDVACTVPIQ